MLRSLIILVAVQLSFVSATFAELIDPRFVHFLSQNTQTNFVILTSYDSNLDVIEIPISKDNIPLNISENILNLHERKFLISGPNCFATALYSSKIEEQIVGVDGPEFQGALNLFCKLVPSPLPGSIGVVSAGDYIFHAFTYINEEVVFEKQNPNGGTNGTNTRFEMFNNMKNRMVSSDCLRSGYSFKDCMPDINYYSCDLNSAVLPQDLKSIHTQINQIKNLMAMNLYIQSPEKFDFKSYTKAKKKLAMIRKYFSSNTQIKASPEWLEYYQNKISSLELQEKYLQGYAQSVAQNIQSF